jgi:hypothetical protein
MSMLLKLPVRNPPIVPRTALPPVTLVIASPVRVYMRIEARDAMTVIGPASIIITWAVPATFPGAPPPTIPEKELYLNIRSNIKARGTG